MADAIVSVVAERIIDVVAEQIRSEVTLVRGVDEEVRKLSEDLTRLRYVLNDAENRRFKEEDIGYWLSRLEHTSYEMEDVLDEWNYALLKYRMDRSNDVVLAPSKQKVCSFVPSSSSCLCFKKVVIRRDIAKKIKNVKQRLDKILKEKDQYDFITSRPTTNPLSESWRVESTSLIDLGNVHGRDKDQDILVSKLMGNGGREEELGNLQVVSIVGVGGLGKTTLAQLVYNDSRVEGSFELRIWVCVSDPFDLAAIAKGIIESVKKGDSPVTNNLQTLLQSVRDCIKGKKFLLVLDDVWTEDSTKWDPLKTSLKCGGAGSKILMTTRNEKVAKNSGTMDDDIHHPGVLSNEDCWLLLHSIALPGRSNVEFEEIGKKIAEKCHGLPLAAKTLGSLLRFKNTLEGWKSVLDSEIWKLEKVKIDLFPHLFLSYNELSPTLKRCFSYCAVFPKDFEINVDNLIGNWMALGYLGSDIGNMELNGREYFDILAMCSLFQDFVKDGLDEIKWCKMHDIVHDFAQFLRKSGKVEATGMNKTTCQTCDSLLVSHVNEFCSLCVKYGESPSNLCNCLKRLRVLSLEKCGLESIPQVIENMIHLRSLSLNGMKQLAPKALKIIFQLYNLQTLCLNYFCNLKEIPMEVKNLIHLRHLDLSWNMSLKELPREIGDVIHLRHLNLYGNEHLKELPESICALNLRTLNVEYCSNLSRLPEVVRELISLRRLSGFHGGSGGNNFRSLKKLNNLSGSLRLRIRLDKDINSEEMVEDAEEAQLRNKIGIQSLDLWFDDSMDENEEWSIVRMKLIDALEPHPKLQELEITDYKGSQLPLGWLVSPLNQLRKLILHSHHQLSSLPPFGILPFLEDLSIIEVIGLEIVGRELLGIGRGGDMDLDTVAFPKLKKLTFIGCHKWKEWEDITAEEEEESAALKSMPCLTHLMIRFCHNLTALPHGLLRKVSTLKVLDIWGSRLLQERYRNKDGLDWKSISQYNPGLRLYITKDL